MAIGTPVQVHSPPPQNNPYFQQGPPQGVLQSPHGNPQHYGQVKGPDVVLPMAASPPSYGEQQQAYNGPPQDVKMLLRPTNLGDLEVYHAMASGEVAQRAAAAIFVLNLYRTTQNDVFPVAERMSVGVSSDSPFYSLIATPATNSTDEINRLTLTRRHPTRGSWADACVTEIQPRVQLVAGVGLVAIMQPRAGHYLSSTPNGDRVGDRFDLTWNGDRGAFAVWRNDGGQNPVLMFEIVTENFTSLDAHPASGVIRVIPQDYTSSGDLGVLSFTAGSGQIIVSNPAAHALLDIIVSAILTVGTVRTRASRSPPQTQQQNSHLAPGGWSFKPAFAETKKEDKWWWIALVIFGWALYILLWIIIIASFLFFHMTLWFLRCTFGAWGCGI